jgi:hypothetical protein
MEQHSQEALRMELAKLLEKQSDFLKSRTLGTATDTEILEYELRRDLIHDICKELAHCHAA